MLEFLLAGPKHRLYFIIEGSHDTLRDLADKTGATGPLAARLLDKPRLEEKKERPDSWKKLLAVIGRTVLHGVEKTASNPSRCKCFSAKDLGTRQEGTIEVCEFKADDLRVLFFKEEPVGNEPCTTLIITHCFKKQRDDTPPVELKRFYNLRRAYYTWREEVGARDAVHAYEKSKRTDL